MRVQRERWTLSRALAIKEGRLGGRAMRCRSLVRQGRSRKGAASLLPEIGRPFGIFWAQTIWAAPARPFSPSSSRSSGTPPPLQQPNLPTPFPPLCTMSYRLPASSAGAARPSSSSAASSSGSSASDDQDRAECANFDNFDDGAAEQEAFSLFEQAKSFPGVAQAVLYDEQAQGWNLDAEVARLGACSLPPAAQSSPSTCLRPRADQPALLERRPRLPPARAPDKPHPEGGALVRRSLLCASPRADPAAGRAPLQQSPSAETLKQLTGSEAFLASDELLIPVLANDAYLRAWPCSPPFARLSARD